jgi:flagellar assembly protein FliH
MTAPFDIQLPGPLLAAQIVAPPAGSAASAGALGPGADDASAESDAARTQEELKDLVQSRRALESAAAAVMDLETQIVAGIEAQLVELALGIAQKVIMQEIEDGRYRVEPIVRDALRHLPTQRDVTVHLNPQDLAQWQKAGSEAADAPPGNLKVAADPTIRRGECRVETAQGVVSATIAERLREAGDSLRSTD